MGSGQMPRFIRPELGADNLVAARLQVSSKVVLKDTRFTAIWSSQATQHSATLGDSFTVDDRLTHFGLWESQCL
jgi:hypothetical protein